MSAAKRKSGVGVWVFLSISTLLLFFGNVAIGKYRLSSGTGLAAPLDGVPEFLLLILSVIFFVIAMLRAGRNGNDG